MKRILCSMFVVAFSSSLVFGTWAMIPLRDLVAESDLIVVGTLNSANEDSSGIGKGYIMVEKVVFGNAKTLDGRPLRVGDNLKIKWADNWACAAGMHMNRQAKKGIWLLEIEKDGTVSAGYPGKFREVEGLDEIRRLLQAKEVTLGLVDLAPQESNSVEAKRFEPYVGPVVDLTPSPDYSFARAAFVFFLAAGLYFLLYRSRFRIH